MSNSLKMFDSDGFDIVFKFLTQTKGRTIKSYMQ